MPMSRYNRYFGGKKGSASKAEQAMESEYGGKKGKSVFYALVNKRKGAASHMPPSASLSPNGDLGVLRQQEAARVGGFTDGAIVAASKEL